MPNASALQIFYGTIPVIVTILVAVWIQNHRFDELSKRIDDLRSDVNARLGDLRDFIRSEIRRLEERIERIERPIVRG